MRQMILTLVLAGALAGLAVGPVAADQTELNAMIDVIEDVVDVLGAEDPVVSLRTALIAKSQLAELDVSPECVDIWAGFYALALAVEAEANLLLHDIDEDRAIAVFDLLYAPAQDLQQAVDSCTEPQR